METVSRAEKYNIHFTVIENSPPLQNFGKAGYESVSFRMPLDKYEDVLKMRFFLWIYYMVRATFLGIMLCRRRRFDAVMTPSGELFCTTIPAFILRAFTSIPLIYVIQLPPPGIPSSGVATEYRVFRSQALSFPAALTLSFYAYTARVLLVKLYSLSELIIVVSNSLKSQLRAYGVNKKMFVVENGISVGEIEEVAYSGPKIFDAVFVGRHTPEKGVFDLVEVWSEVAKTVPTARLLLLGYYTYDMKTLLDKQLQKYGLLDKVMVKGVVSRKQLIQYMKQSKLLLFLSRYESFSLTIGEALACGLPVICYDIPPILEFYQSEAVLRCPIRDLECVKKQVIRILLDAELRKGLSSKAKVYLKKFDWERTVGVELRFYKRVYKFNEFCFVKPF